MSTLYQAIRTYNPHGLEYDEAQQLFLWIYCTVDILPLQLRREPIGKEMLVETFDKLTTDGLIKFPNSSAETEFSRNRVIKKWTDIVDELLSNRIALDPTFPQRVQKYVMKQL